MRFEIITSKWQRRRDGSWLWYSPKDYVPLFPLYFRVKIGGLWFGRNQTLGWFIKLPNFIKMPNRRLNGPLYWSRKR